MKRIIFLLFILLSACELQAQDSIKSTKWSLGFSVSPDYTYRIVPNQNAPERSIYSSLNYWIKDHVPKGGIHLTLLAGYKVSENFKIESGLNLFNNGFKTKPFNIITYGRDHTIVGIDTLQLKYNYYYLGIPVWLIGRLNCSKMLSFELGAGISMNCLTVRRTVPNEWGSNTKIDGFHAVLMAKVGINYIIDKNLSLDIAPNFNYFITPVHDLYARDGNNDLNLYTAGIEFGLKYNFSRKKK
jgi:hypothetical protein